MPRPSLGAISQEQLTYELKRWTDVARFALDDSAAYQRAKIEILELVRQNQVSVLRPHVLHNLGQRRRAWLRQLAATLPPFGRDILEQM